MQSVPYPNSLWSRLLSFFSASGYSLTLLVYPGAVTGLKGEVSHGALTLLLWGVAAGFIHGVGFVPLRQIWRVVFHPFLGWLLMGGIAFMLIG